MPQGEGTLSRAAAAVKSKKGNIFDQAVRASGFSSRESYLRSLKRARRFKGESVFGQRRIIKKVHRKLAELRQQGSRDG